MSRKFSNASIASLATSKLAVAKNAIYSAMFWRKPGESAIPFPCSASRSSVNCDLIRLNRCKMQSSSFLRDSYSSESLDSVILTHLSKNFSISSASKRDGSHSSSGHLGKLGSDPEPPMAMAKLSHASRQTRIFFSNSPDQAGVRPKASNHSVNSVRMFGSGVYLGPAVALTDSK